MRHQASLIVLCFGVLSLAVPSSSVILAAGNLNLAAHKTRLALTSKPEGAEQVLAVQKLLVAAKTPRGSEVGGQPEADAPKAREVVVSGQIGGMPNVWPDTHPHFPWYDGQASFFLVDSKVAAQFATHAKQHGGNHQCSFCKSLAAKNAHAIAVVNLVDEKGETLRIDTRKLLALKENQTVIIRGKAKLLAGSMLVIDADGIYAPR